MEERFANYYAHLNPQDGEEPFAVLPAGQEYSYQPTYPEEVASATGFVPYSSLAWNRIEFLGLIVGDVVVELKNKKREYGMGTGNAYVDVWAWPSADNESPVLGELDLTAVEVRFFDYSMFTVVATVGGKTYSYSGAAEEGELSFNLVLDPSDSTNALGKDEISATMTTLPVKTATGTQLNYYAVYATETVTHRVLYKWYDKNALLNKIVDTVEDGGALPKPPDVDPVGPNWTGNWLSNGGEVPSGPVKSDIEAEYVQTTDAELELDWGIEGSGDAKVVNFKWCHPYPQLAVKPDFPAGKTLKGIYLVRDDLDVKRVYNTAANPCAAVIEDITQAGYSLKARWMPSSAVVKGISDLRGLVGAIPSPFASIETARVGFPDEPSPDPSAANFKTGFPPVFARPFSAGGKVVTRRMVNAIGNLGTQAQFFQQCGGYYTFDQGFCDAIGGYPKDAVLQFYQESTRSLRSVRSLVDNNAVNFLESGVDGVNWAYVGDNPVVSVKVDYSSYEDLSERLFVETGVPDLYEVPYDSYLQAFAVGSVDCDSLRRPTSEDVTLPYYYDEDSFAYYEVRINGLYFASGHGQSFIDVYHGDSQSFGSVLIGGFHPVTMFQWGGNIKLHHAVRACPLSAFSCGVLLSKGDKIRVRNVIAEKNAVTEQPSGNNNFVHPMVHGDETMRRKYNYRFAALYKRGLVQ